MPYDQHARERINNLELRLSRLEDRNLDIRVMPKFNFGFGNAIRWLKSGVKVSRWLRDDIYLTYHPADGSKAEEIRVKTVQGYFAPWTANHSELLAKDWRVIDDEGDD